MSAISWRDALTAGLSLVAIATPVAAQEQELLTLEDALSRTGVVGETADPELNPRIVGPRAEAEAAQALVGQARLRPNPELSFEVENIAGSGAFSGLSATEYTLSPMSSSAFSFVSATLRQLRLPRVSHSLAMWLSGTKNSPA